MLLPTHEDSLRGVRALCGGEPLSSSIVQWLRRVDASVTNGYGPTETTVYASTHAIPAADTLPHERVPIGTPLANCSMHVLGAGLQLLPVGVAGELYVGGASLARGYLNQPAATAERFVANPYGGPGSRLYRTGDRARWRADGTLDFLGRVDHQVKIRGFRVESGEVEAALRTHPSVADAVVAIAQTAAEPRLVAYVTPAGGRTIDPAALRRHVTLALPQYMVPSTVVALEAFPLTKHGKVDRSALPSPEWQMTTASRAPSTPDEEALCRLFAEVLDLDAVGVDDSFFDLGGDSLVAVRLTNQLRATQGIWISISTVFDSPTVGELAPLLAAARRKAGVAATAIVTA
jgi:nonribosomal peptide synthetase DhbF